MPKIRGFKPDLWTDEDFVELSPFARLLWMGMWNYACDNGHLADKSKQIKMRILPTDDVNCAELLRELEANGRIHRAAGTITIPNFGKHQKPDKRYFQTCDAPGCARPDGDSQRETRGANAGTPRGSWGPHDEVKGSEVKGSDGEGRSAGKPAKRATQLPDTWRPNDAHRAFAADNLLSIDDEVAQFADHHRARGSSMKDWDAAFRTWLRNAIKFRKEVPQPPRKLTRAADLEQPPDGLTDQEYAAWYARRRA